MENEVIDAIEIIGGTVSHVLPIFIAFFQG
jgi:hypothetical protein